MQSSSNFPLPILIWIKKLVQFSFCSYIYTYAPQCAVQYFTICTCLSLGFRYQTIEVFPLSARPSLPAAMTSATSEVDVKESHKTKPNTNCFQICKLLLNLHKSVCLHTMFSQSSPLQMDISRRLLLSESQIFKSFLPRSSTDFMSIKFGFLSLLNACKNLIYWNSEIKKN